MPSPLPWSQVRDRTNCAGSRTMVLATHPATCSEVRFSILRSIPMRVVRSTKVATALLPPSPMIRSPSQCPGTARSPTSAGRSEMFAIPTIWFIAHAVADWCRFNGTGTVFIDPGSPWQNAWIESFNGRMRDEHLNGQQFDSLLEGPSADRGLEDRLQHQQAPQRTRLAHPGRVRRGLAPPTGTAARIAGGPTIGVPSPRITRPIATPAHPISVGRRRVWLRSASHWANSSATACMTRPITAASSSERKPGKRTSIVALAI